MANQSVEAAIAGLEANMVNFSKLLDLHTRQDASSFNSLDEKLDRIEIALETIKIQLAREAGEKAGKEAAIKRHSAIISGAISLIVAILGVVVKFHA